MTGLTMHEAYEANAIRLQGQAASDISQALSNISLRDLFAMNALSGMLANPSDFVGTQEQLANTAYVYADAMITARKKK